MSALNCRPGDLAVKVRCHERDIIPLGAIVRCVYVAIGDLWSVEYQGHQIDPRDGRGWAALDSNLKPIRDPGEDARDETLSWKRVPSSSTTKDAEVSNG